MYKRQAQITAVRFGATGTVAPASRTAHLAATARNGAARLAASPSTGRPLLTASLLITAQRTMAGRLTVLTAVRTSSIVHSVATVRKGMVARFTAARAAGQDRAAVRHWTTVSFGATPQATVLTKFVSVTQVLPAP